jgi:hypothetical protein
MMVWGGEREREKGRRTYLVDVLRRVTLRGSTRVREENTREREVWGEKTCEETNKRCGRASCVLMRWPLVVGPTPCASPKRFRVADLMK